MPSRSVTAFAVSLATSLLTGCNDYQFDVAPVRGTVTCEGQPLSSGAISFSPIAEGSGEPGKPALGAIQPDGSFVLSTYAPDDGAVIGRHRVTYIPPLPPGEGEEGDEEDGVSLPQLPLPADHPCVNGGTSPQEVEVVGGENNLTIELTGLTVEGEEEGDSGEGE